MTESVKRLRVLHIISGLETGGAETSLTRLILGTSPEVEHVVVSLTGTGTQGPLLTRAGVRVHPLEWPRGRVPFSGLRQLIALVRHVSPDIVQGWMYHANLVASVAAIACGMRKSLVWSIRHSLDDWSHESSKLRFIIRLNAWLSRLPASILFNSERSRLQHEQLGFLCSRSQTIANGVDTQRFAPDATRRDSVRRSLRIEDDAVVIGLIARVHPIKGHHLFLEAMAELRKQVPSLRVVLAGRGTDDHHGVVEDCVKALGLHATVHRLGDRPDTEAIYNTCDLTVLASSSEAFPNAVVESMSCGVPCVVTDVGDAALIVGNETQVVPAGYPTAIAAACLALLKEETRTAVHRSIAVRQRVIDNFSSSRAEARYRALWDRLAGAVSERNGTAAEPKTNLKVLHVLTASMSLNFLRGQREWLASQGVELHVACSGGKELSEWESQSPGTAHRIAMQRAITPFADVGSVIRLVRLIRRERFDVVHAGTPKGGMLGMIAARLCRVPLRIYHVRGLPLTTARGLSKLLLSASERLSIACSTRVLAVSHSLRGEIAAAGLCAESRIRVIGSGSSNGVDARVRFNPRSVDASDVDAVRRQHDIEKGEIVIGFVGRLTRDKGIAELLGAWKTVRSRHSNVRLLIVGEEDDASEETRNIVAGFRGDPRVHLHGADWDTPRLFESMSMLVLPTYREGFPNVLLEAAAMRLPVVATSVAGCVDAVRHEKTGLLVPPRDSAALAAAIDRYVSNGALRRSHGAAARAMVLESYDRHVIWAGLAELYRTGDVRSSSAEPVVASQEQVA